ncbi:glycosyltransferase family 2 protein [Sulfitobacter sp.]|uniref:glycosyltransferase family 2 protein n=1 Tax=Sulfitobacter sp. TaxID=1903071 RepID=UPI0039E6AA32
MSDLRLQFTTPEPAAPAQAHMPLGRILVNSGAIDHADLVRALQDQQRLNVPLGECLIASGAVSSAQLCAALAVQYNLQHIDLAVDPPKAAMAQHLDALDCLKYGIVPWRSLGDTIMVAVSTPDQFDQIALQVARSGVSLLPVIADNKQISESITALYGAELAQRAAIRVPPIESCRTWRADAKSRRAWSMGILALMAIVLVLEPAWGFTIILLWALCSSVMIVSLRTVALFTHVFLRKVPPSPPPQQEPDHPFQPHVSVLVPLFREKEIAGALIARLAKLTYPKSLLQIVLVLEEGDDMTRDTIARTKLPSWFDVIEVPQANSLRTKPRAMNYALDFCKGSIIGVWDAEDAPEVDQIDRVIRHFANAPKNVVCVQGMLDYYNARTNWISRCFTIEYAAWWRVVLPGIARLGFIVPLGGTTLFFRRTALEELRGWDAHNVTEDADLGVRLARHGYKTDLLPTVTYEEANFRAWPWVKQRSRWLKGFLTTWCVHMRQPLKLIKQVGFLRFLGLQILFLATVSQFLCAPLLWTLCITLVGLSHPVETVLGIQMLKGLFFYFIFAELVNISIALRAVRGKEHRHLIPWAFSLPFYFILGTFAAYKALYEFIFHPFYWDKTEHGVPHKTDEKTAPPTPVPTG